MDPELKAAVRGLKAGSREYKAAVDKFMSDKAKRQGEAEERKSRLENEAGERKAKTEREAADAASKRARDEAEAKSQRESRETAEKATRDRQTSLITAGSALTGLTGGMTGGYYADKYGTAKANKVLTGRAEGARNLAQAARNIDPGQAAARSRFAEIATSADKTGVLKPKVVPYGGLGVAGTLGGLGAYSTFYRAPHAQSDEERALWTGAGYGELGAGAKMLASSAHRYMNPEVTLPPDAVADIEFARRQGAGTGPIGGYNQSAPQPPGGGVPPAGNNPPPPPSQVFNSKRLIDAAKAAGATGKLTKESAAKYLARNVTDQNRSAVASALGVKSGPNFASRTKATIKDLRGTKGKSSWFIPMAAGALAYDAARSQAKAAGSSEMSAQGTGLAAGAGAAGLTAAVPYAISKMPASVGTALNAAGPGLAPGMVDAITDYSPDDLAMARNAMARNAPSWARGGAVENAYQMAQTPQRNPMFSGGISQDNQGEDFETVLGEVMQHLEQ